MRVLITGGAGFAGSDFARHLARHRPTWDVVVLDALTYAANPASLAPLADRITFHHGDVTDPVAVAAAMDGAEAVVHFAAQTHNDRSLTDPASFVHTNIVGTFHLLEAVRRTGARLHHVSTDEVFGDLDFDDTTVFGAGDPMRPSSPYSATKASSDLLVGAWARSFGIVATVSNSSNLYGPYQHPEKFIPRQVTRILTGQRAQLYGQGRNLRDWLHVEDHSAAVLAILESGRPGQTYLLGSGAQVSNRAVLEKILALMGRPAGEFDPVSDRPGHDRRYGLDVTATRAGLGWEPARDLRAGLADTIRWYADHPQWWATALAESEAHYARSPHPIANPAAAADDGPHP